MAPARSDLTTGPDDETDPSWSPDGTQIAFVGFPAGGGSRDIFSDHLRWAHTAAIDDDGTIGLRAGLAAAPDLHDQWNVGTRHPGGTDANDVICGRGGDDTIDGGTGTTW